MRIDHTEGWKQRNQLIGSFNNPGDCAFDENGSNRGGEKWS